MAADDPKFGINRFPGTFIDEVQVKEKTNVAERKDRLGVTKRVYPFDPMAEVSVKGGGEPALALGVVASPGVTGITGGVFIVKERTHTQKGDGFDEFDLSATHYPNAALGTAVT